MRLTPWKPSQPATTSQTRVRAVPPASVKVTRGRSPPGSCTDTSSTSNRIGAARRPRSPSNTSMAAGIRGTVRPCGPVRKEKCSFDAYVVHSIAAGTPATSATSRPHTHSWS
ncbi:hypothetical protein GCM10010429_55530 [Micromonospora olivasterospora]